MSKQLVKAPLAVTSEGRVLVNLAEFDGPRDPQTLLDKAQRTKGQIFIGVELDRHEVAAILEDTRHSYADSVAHIVGRRQRG